MLTTEFQYHLGMTIRRLQDRVANGPVATSADPEEEAKNRLDDAIVALVKARIELDD